MNLQLLIVLFIVIVGLLGLFLSLRLGKVPDSEQRQVKRRLVLTKTGMVFFFLFLSVFFGGLTWSALNLDGSVVNSWAKGWMVACVVGGWVVERFIAIIGYPVLRLDTVVSNSGDKRSPGNVTPK